MAIEVKLWGAGGVIDVTQRTGERPSDHTFFGLPGPGGFVSGTIVPSVHKLGAGDTLVVVVGGGGDKVKSRTYAGAGFKPPGTRPETGADSSSAVTAGVTRACFMAAA